MIGHLVSKWSKQTMAIVGIAAIVMFGFLLTTKPADAHPSPAQCNASAIQQIPSVAPLGDVYDGSVLTYTVTYSNLDPDGAGSIAPCNITLADATIDLPGAGGLINVLNDATLNVGDSIACPGGAGCAAGPYTYAVSHGDEVSESVTAVFDISGVLHQDGNEEAASDHDTLSKTVIHPSTVINISSSSPTAVSGGTVDLTVTEQNDGDVDLTNVSVTVDNGVGVLTAPPDSGDTGDDGVLGVGETWSWTVTTGVINSDTTFTATGTGTDPNGTVITYPGDQDEQDSVTVEVVLGLVVEKTVETSYERKWNWTISKPADQTDLLLQESESFIVNYDVTVDADAVVQNAMVSGTITITNPEGNPTATISSVTDTLSDDGGPVEVVCPGGLPQQLAAGASLVCTYSEELAGADNQTNTATVTTTGDVPGGSDEEAVTFVAPNNVFDECINVSDTNDTDSVLPDQICADETLPFTYEYSVVFGPNTDPEAEVITACGEMNHPNTASFVTNDTATEGSDNASVNVEVDCFQGCTLTQGYWKTHNDYHNGGKHADETWELLPGGLGEDTIFFLSGQTWYNVFKTAPKGNVYYNLAHQYMAAKLNILAGASAPANVMTAITNAEALFGANTPAQAAALKGAAKNTWTTLAGTLGSYNEGLIGPGHCDEQNPS